MHKFSRRRRRRPSNGNELTNICISHPLPAGTIWPADEGTTTSKSHYDPYYSSSRATVLLCVPLVEWRPLFNYKQTIFCDIWQPQILYPPPPPPLGGWYWSEASVVVLVSTIAFNTTNDQKFIGVFFAVMLLFVVSLLLSVPTTRSWVAVAVVTASNVSDTLMLL